MFNFILSAILINISEKHPFGKEKAGVFLLSSSNYFLTLTVLVWIRHVFFTNIIFNRFIFLYLPVLLSIISYFLNCRYLLTERKRIFRDKITNSYPRWLLKTIGYLYFSFCMTLSAFSAFLIQNYEK